MKRSESPQAFIASFSYDVRLAPYDIQGSIAHAKMLGRCRIVPGGAVERIVQGLKAIQADLVRGKRLPLDEDIHYAIERELIRRVGEPGEMLHTARSRNDQITTDLRLYLKDQTDMLTQEIVRLQKSICSLAHQHKNLIMPGFTHMQHAQPILFSHHLLAYAWMLERDKGRLADCRKRADELPLGSAALAGTSFPIDRRYTARLLGFSRVSENSVDSVSDRDFVIEFLACAAGIMMHLSRLSEELIIWSSPEFNFVRIQEEFTSGSSIMPQKRNPDTVEIIRAETGRVYGALVALLTMMKALPLAYNRDLQEDKPPLFDAVDTLMACLTIMAPLVLTLQVNGQHMRKLCEKGYLAATELADYLAEKGVPFRSAHRVVGDIVEHCRRRGILLEDLKLKDLRKFHKRFDRSALKVLSPEEAVRAKTSYGGTSPQSVERQIRLLSAALVRK